MKKVLVTGVTGYTGGHLAKTLLKKGFKVHGLALPDQEASSLERAGVKVFKGDLRVKDSLIPAVQGMDRVYHIAAIYREQDIPTHLFFDVNVDGTRNLLEASRDARVERFIHCSTVGVQGEIENPPASEEHPYKPGDYYQESKMQGELLALEFFKNGLAGVIFRPVGIYGPGDTRFLKLFRFIYNGKFRMIGAGEVLYHLTYIDDLVEGIIQVGETKGIEGEIITLAGERYTTINELVQSIADVLEVRLKSRHYPVWPFLAAGAVCEFLCKPFPIHPPIYRRRVDFFTKDRAFDISKAKHLLKYQPKVDLIEGLKRTADWYKSQGLLD